MGLFTAIAGAVLPKLIGGLFGRREERKQQKQAVKAAEGAETRSVVRDTRADALARARYVQDRKNERAYAGKQTAADRAYAESRARDERAYAARVSAKDRANFVKDRAHAERVAADFTASQSALAVKRERAAEGRAEASFKADRASQQKLSDRYAEKTAASRGIDFQSLRDDAMKAGFNPLTALQFAQSYSTERNYQMEGGTWSGGTGGGGGGAAAAAPPAMIGGGSTMAGPGAVLASQPAQPSSYSSPGTGYAATPTPILSSSSFLGDALATGVGAAFDYKAEQEERTVRSIENQVAYSQLRRESARSNPYQDFGFSTAKQRPYRSAVTVSNGSGFDPVHGRDVEKQPVMDVPLTGYYDIGGGKRVRGLSQDVEWSEFAQWANEAWVGGNVAVRRIREVPAVSKFRQGLSNRLATGHKYAITPRGARSVATTGSNPVLPLMGWGGI